MAGLKLTQTRSRDTRTAILRAAADLFSAQGASGTSVEDIARAAGLSKASVFAHFGDKTALVAAVGLDRLTKVDAALSPVLDQGLPLPGPALASALTIRLRFFLAHADFARLYLMQAGLTQSPASAAFIAHCSAESAALTRALATANPWLGANATLAAHGAEAHLQQVLVYRLAGWTPTDGAAEANLASALDVWAAGLVAQHGTRPGTPHAP
jgi:AcrR family transcriptional regulator